MRSFAILCIGVVSLFFCSPVCAGNNKWTPKGPQGGSFRVFSFHPTKKGVVFAGGDSGLFRSMDSGTTWKRMDVDSWVVAIHPKNPGKILAVNNLAFSSTDLGETWQVITTTPFGDGIKDDVAFDPQNPDVFYAVGDNQGVFKSTDGGITWVSKNKGLNCMSAQAAVCLSLLMLPNRGAFLIQRVFQLPM